MPTRSSRWSRASRSFRRMLQRGNGSWKTSAICLAELQTLPECSCVSAEALEERRLAKRALTSWRSSRHFERDCCEARALEGRWLVETRVRCSHATMAAAQRARCRSRLVFLPLRAAASWRRQPGWYSFSLRCIVSTQQWWPWLHTRSHEQRKRPEGDLQEASEVSQWRWWLAWGLAWSPARPGAGERPEGDLQKPRVSSMNDYGWLGA